MSTNQELVDAVSWFEQAVRDAEGYFAGPRDFAILDRARRHLLDLAGRERDRAEQAEGQISELRDLARSLRERQERTA